MRKTAFCICEHKDADQLLGYSVADQRLCFRYINSTMALLSKSEISSLAIFCACTALFVSDLVGNPVDRFSRDTARLSAAVITLNAWLCSHMLLKLYLQSCVVFLQARHWLFQRKL